MDPWGDVVDVFVGKHYAAARGQVRTALIDRQLASHLPDREVLEVIDVGAGGGTQSIPWARRGHRVTLVDRSPAMLDAARQTLSGEDQTVASRVTIIEADAMDLVSVVEPGSYDVVMCHGVIMYFDDPVPLMEQLAAVAAPRGVVSVLAKNRRAMAVRPGLERKWTETVAAFDATHETNRLGFDTRADDPDELAAVGVGVGLTPREWYGVRYFTEVWPPDEAPSPEAWPLILEAEERAGRTDPYRSMSRLVHCVFARAGTKSGSPRGLA